MTATVDMEYLNMQNFPRSGDGLERNYKALLLSIIYPSRVLGPEEALGVIITGRRPPEKRNVVLTVPAETLQQCIKLQEQGVTLRELARRYGYHESRLCRQMNKYRQEVLGERSNNKGSRTRTPEERERILRMMAKCYAEGKTPGETAECIGVNIASVGLYARSPDFKKLMESMRTREGAKV
jgi:transposase-like protein